MVSDNRKEIELLKIEYEKHRKKYNFPSFEEMNNEFEIEKLRDEDGTGIFLRKLRRAVMEKILYLLSLLEKFVNPQSAPMFILAIAKNLGGNSSKIIEKLYKECCELEIDSLQLDIVPDEKKEVELIKKIIKTWKILKKDADELNKNLSKAWAVTEKKEIKGYTG